MNCACLPPNINSCCVAGSYVIDWPGPRPRATRRRLQHPYFLGQEHEWSHVDVGPAPIPLKAVTEHT